ncbi:GTPase [Vibrio mimicus CAIM 1883]|nr:GTPase [Vibrio mimicus CAIM 1882]ERM54411.1 GTPase [Vibrio mimicus CAIM 1883]
MFLDYFALGLLIFVALVIFYGIIVIHDIPYEIAKERDHPHQDAIHYAGWVSLFTLHALWPFLWIWATLWRKERGWGFQKLETEQHDIHHRVDVLIDEVKQLRTELETLKSSSAPVAPTAVVAPTSEEKQ